MGALEDYYNSLGGAVSSPPPAAAGGADPSQPGYTSYVGQQNGGAQSGSRGFMDVLTGQDNTHVNPALQATLPDAGDVAAVNSATAEYQKQHDAWTQELLALKARIHSGDINEIIHAKENLDALTAREPQKPDLSAIQHQSDRNRLLNIGIGAYTPLIASLSSAAAGNGPSAALNYYRAAADDASRRTLGAAASARGTGGSRAALYQAALRQNAEATQGAANQASQIGAQEQNQARASLNAALAGLTNVYGTSNLLGDTQQQQAANQQAQNQAIGLNTQIAENNARNATDFAKTAIKTGAEAAGAV